MIPVHWPYSPQTYQAFAAMKKAGFTAYCCGDRRAPNVLVAAYDWGGYMDVINSRGVDRTTAARLPTYETPPSEPFRPEYRLVITTTCNAVM